MIYNITVQYLVLIRGQEIRKLGNHWTAHWDVLPAQKSINMLYKNIPGVKKCGQVRSTSYIALIHSSTKKSDIWWRLRNKVFACSNARSITYIFQKGLSLSYINGQQI